jgi:hypothetical protein
MKNQLTITILFCMVLLTGGTAMAGARFLISPLNQDKLDTLKKEMGYDSVIQQLPKDKIVILDWENTLKGFTDTNGRMWRISSPSSSMHSYEGRLSANLKSGNEVVRIVVHSMSLGQKDAIDLALWQATNTSAPFIWYKYDPRCFSNFCLIPRAKEHVSALYFNYGNILIELDHFDVDKDVIPVARYLQSAMEKAVAENPEQKLPPRPKITYTMTPTQITTGETFTVTAKQELAYQKVLWNFDIAQKLISDNINCKEDMGDFIYKFMAKATGKGSISYNLMNKKTLWVFTDVVSVNIEPEK